MYENDILQQLTLQNSNPETYETIKKVESYYLQILSHTCHDLRNSTGLIDGYVQILEKQMPQLRTNPIWAKLHRNTKDALLLLDHIGEFRYSHIIEDKETISVETFRTYLEKIYPNLNIITESGISEFYGTLHTIQTSVLALIQNAIEADCDARLPELTLKADDDFFHVIIRDNGSGFDEKSLSKVFEPFQTGKKGHTGLGLSLARNTAVRHGGNLIIRNLYAPTIIDFYIPLKLK